jgi:hypothetical protein
VLALAGAAHADPAPACPAGRAHCFGLRVHVAADDHGPVATPAWLADELAQANRLFAPLDVGFVVTASDALPASAARVASRDDRNAFAAQVTGQRELDIFVISELADVDTAGKLIHGVTWRRPGKVYIFLVSSGLSLVLAHELGHVFGLPHSTEAISIMNKTPRLHPSYDELRFADDELPIMRRTLAALLKRGVLAEHPIT